MLDVLVSPMPNYFPSTVLDELSDQVASQLARRAAAKFVDEDFAAFASLETDKDDGPGCLDQKSLDDISPARNIRALVLERLNESESIWRQCAKGETSDTGDRTGKPHTNGACDDARQPGAKSALPNLDANSRDLLTKYLAELDSLNRRPTPEVIRIASRDSSEGTSA